MALFAGLWAVVAAGACAFPGLTTEACLINEDPEEGCADCERQSCCAELEACRQSDACVALDGCLQTCVADDAECRASCAAEHPPDDAAAALSRCRQSGCHESCTTCGGYFASPTASCDACLATSCCAEQLACRESASCQAAMDCREACARPGCTKSCGQKNLAGLTAYESLLRCINDQCFEGCGVGQNDDCQGNYELGSSSTGSVAFNEFLFSITDEPLVGVNVKACVRQDLDCSDPVDEAVTGGLGGFTFSLPATMGGWDGFFQYEGVGVYPALRYTANPLVEDALRGGFFPFRLQDFGDVIDELGPTDDPARGHLVLTAGDCLDGNSPGVSFSLDGGAEDGATRFYYADGLPVFSATETQSKGPPYGGVGGFVNVLPGTVVVRSRLAATEEPIRDVTAVVRAGFITYLRLVP